MNVLQRIKEEQTEKEKVLGDKWDNSLELVFVNENGSHLSKVTTYNHLKRIARKMDKPDLRFHDLRHSYAVLSIQTGANLKTLQSQMGHATTAFTLDVYGHITDSMRKDAAD